MNQLALSTDLQVITAEINSYKQVAGQSLFEIGKRLKHVKDNDLAHGEFGKWLQSVEIEESQARRFMKVASELEERGTFHGLGLRALYEIATMPPDEREKPHFIESSSETKKPVDMTTRELQEVKKTLKETQQEKDAAELRAKQAETARQLSIQQHTEQQEKLQQEIAILKKRKGRSKEDEETLQQMTEEINQLSIAKRQMEEEFQERYSALEKKQYDLRKMKEALSKTRAYVEVDLSTALVHFMPIHEQREAIQAAVLFWAELDETVNHQRAKWLKAMENQVIEEVGEDARKAVVIEG
ncbi:hypothetical protein [Paenibacillus wynnii]|uniref:hypothetical protein n=1 Tax=Paenibacillus wynnii TaxID=268407 RepID=UPI00068B3268|nr:hypothetical protein [Paenibacillus wynnii]